MANRTIEPAGTAANSSYLGRIATLLRFLADRTEMGARAPEICKHLDIHRVSAHRMLKSLLDLGYVEQAPDLSYHLGFEAWSLGIAASRRFIPAAVSGALKRISDESEEGVFLMRKIGNEGICIGFHEGTFPVRTLVMRIGARRHLGVGGTSVAILAGLPSTEAETIMKENTHEYPRFGITAKDVRQFVNKARTQGYAYSYGVVVPESRTVAVPLSLFANSSAMMSISIITLQSRLQQPRREELVRLLKREAAALSAAAS